ncbi:hypothetical protein MMC26_000603 [Xylographa opegraphella]|nr:hypothetical protein [Xylographa opegraphella]
MERDTEDSSSSRSEAYWHAEQAQALLVEDGDGNDEHGKFLGHESRTRNACNYFRQHKSWSTAILSVFLVLITTGIVWWFGSEAPLIVDPWQAALDAAEPHHDYTLDRNWDFDAPPRTREYWWTIENAELNPDGVYKSMIVINGQFPGPMINCNEGDTVIVNVKNKGMNATSIHWHGIYQNGTNWMDGTVGITQCPIASGGIFTYEFKISGQSGSYWYHAHQGTQVADGLYGPLVVHSRLEKKLQEIRYDSDRVIMVQDYYHDASGALLLKYLEPDRENAEPVPDGALINGKNVRNCDALPHRKCDNTTAGLATLELAPSQNHRLRFINTGSFAEFQIQVDEHEFAVTEVDGTDVKPAYYHRLNINPGQRYSIVLKTDRPTAGSFWLRARMITDCFAERNADLIPEVRAVVQYSQDEMRSTDGMSYPLPKSLDWPEAIEQICKDMNTTELIPATITTAPAAPDAVYYLWANFQIGDWRLSRGFFNDSSWKPDVYSPTLSRYIEGYSVVNESFTSTENGSNEVTFDNNREMVIQIAGIQTIDIIIQNFDDGNHPMHLHGYKYFVLAQGHGYFPWDTYNSLNLSNPLRRDTASVQAYSWLLIRLVTDNPGMWALHCHISWHTEAGMLMQFLIRPEIVSKWSLPVANTNLCQAEGLENGMTPGDDTWSGDTG